MNNATNRLFYPSVGPAFTAIQIIDEMNKCIIDEREKKKNKCKYCGKKDMLMLYSNGVISNVCNKCFDDL